MAQGALGPGSAIRRRALFGLLDASGWSWASLKAAFWFIVIILLLGYLPDRAYYFTVFPTIDLGLLAWSPVNLCPPENLSLPCPAPAGAALPWQESPGELSLPLPRTDGAAVQAGSKILYIGGSDGSAPTTSVFIADQAGTGNFSAWRNGPALPEARTNAAAVFLNGVVYVLGGSDASGAPTDSTFVATVDAATGEIGDWRLAADAQLPLALPAARTGLAVVPAPDGIIAVGGSDTNGPTTSVWKSTLDKAGKPGAWAVQAPLARPQSDAGAFLNGNFLWLVGGTDANGASGAVQRGEIGTAGDDLGKVVRWGLRDGPPNLPVARSDAATFAANGVFYVAGGTDGTSPKSELYWATPDSRGEIPEWKHLPQSDLPTAGLAGSAALVSGANAFLIGGQTSTQVNAQSLRTNLAPQPPFFQLGLVGATVPALKIEGEIGQQLGYLNAAAVGTIDFVILVLIGWAFAHKEQSLAMWRRLRRRS